MTVTQEPTIEEVLQADTPGEAKGERNGIDIARLTRAFPEIAIKTRQGGGGSKFRYLETHSVINRLNREAVEWSWVLTGERLLEAGTDKNGNPEMVLVVTGNLTIPGLGTRAGTGIQRFSVFTKGAHDDMIKGAESDALKRAAHTFGIGIQLYGKDPGVNYEDVAEAAPAGAPQSRPAATNGVSPQAERPAQAIKAELVRLCGQKGVAATMTMTAAEIASAVSARWPETAAITITGTGEEVLRHFKEVLLKLPYVKPTAKENG